jgi:HEAT repeat protein
MGLFGEFSLQFSFNFWTFMLILAYIGAIAGGYYLIAIQVKLVKKEVWNVMDRLKCFMYGFFFANGVIIILAMMATFATANNYKQTGVFIIIPLLFCLIFITIYPLFDFLYMASSQEELAMTPFQEVIEKLFINKLKKPWSYIFAVILYVSFFIFPPFILVVFLEIDMLIAWISWELIFPMGIVTYYGAKGYISGLVNAYSQWPRISRSSFLTFDSSNRASKEFIRNPVPRAVTGIMIFLYFWTMVSFVTTVSGIVPDLPDPSGTMSYAFMVYIVLILGITGYFSRFWGRKIKFKTMDIMFAAFLIAAVGINVLTNFLLVNSAMLATPFQEWSLTQVINEEWMVNSSGDSIKKFRIFALAAAIEECILISTISFYFFEKKHQFMNDTIFASVTKAGDSFNPVPPFNLASSKDKKQREHAYNILRVMYDRIPLKIGFYLTDDLYKDALLDAVCDSNKYCNQIGIEILGNLMENSPKKVYPLVEEALSSSNYDKTLNVLKIVRKRGAKILPILPVSILYELINHQEYHIRWIAIHLLKEKYSESIASESSTTKKDITKPNESEFRQIITLLEDPDYEIQAEALELLQKFADQVPSEIFSSRLNHHIPRIRSIAAGSVAGVDVENISEYAIPTLIDMLDHANPQIKSAVMASLAKIGKFKENKIPIDVFKDGLIDQNEEIRNSAQKGVVQYIKEMDKGFNIDKFLDGLTSKDIGIQKTLVIVIGSCWKRTPDKAFNQLIGYLRSPESDIKNLASKYIIEMGLEEPKKIINKLILETETESFIRSGMITTSITAIGKKNPEIVLPILEDSIKSDKDHIRINSASVYGALSEQLSEKIPLKPLLHVWLNDQSIKVKKSLVKVFSNIAIANPNKFKPLLPIILQSFNESEKSIRVTIARLFVDISQKVPKLIPLSAVKSMVSDEDAQIRENGMNILGYLGKDFPKESLKMIMEGLNDEDWSVKNSATEAFGILGENVDNPMILDEIKKLLNDESKWTRLKALEIIIKVADKKPDILSIDEILNLLKMPDQDETFKINTAKLLGILGFKEFDKLFPIMIDILQDPSEKIRQGMITGMVKLSSKMEIKELIPKLLFYLSDETEIILQQSIALLLKRIVKYESEAIKSRVISLLKIRCEMSQDSIICEVLSDLSN